MTETTQECLKPKDQEALGQYDGAREVGGIGVQLSESGRTVVLALNDPGRWAGPMVYLLSPPAAAQLSRLLKQAVKKHLRATPDGP